MKRFLTYLTTTFAGFTLLVTPVSAATTTRFWKVDIYQPSATTNKTLKVEYKVLSTIKEDNNYTIELFENNVSKGSQGIAHEYGDSGVFNIAIPAAGTYTYKVVATNPQDTDGDQTEEDTSTVQVSNDPEPVVTTVVVTQPAAGGVGGGAGAGAGAQAGVAPQPAVAGAETTAPQTSSTTTSNQGVLGAEAAKERAKQASNRNKYLIPSALFIVLAIAGYALYKRRSLANE